MPNSIWCRVSRHGSSRVTKMSYARSKARDSALPFAKIWILRSLDALTRAWASMPCWCRPMISTGMLSLHASMAVLRGVEGGFSVVRSARHGLLTVSSPLRPHRRSQGQCRRDHVGVGLEYRFTPHVGIFRRNCLCLPESVKQQLYTD